MKSKINIIVLALLAVLMPVSVFAGGKLSKVNVYVGAEEVIDGNFVAAGRTVTIDGTINGDVIVAGRTIVINGLVAGDVIAAGCSIHVAGPVRGDVRLAGCDIRLSGVVGKNATIAGGNVELSKDSAIGWGAMVFAGNLQVLGTITKDLRGMAKEAILNGAIGEDVWLKIKESKGLILQPNAWIGGDLVYSSRSMATIMSGATIVGQVDFKSFPQKFKGKYQNRGSAIGLLLVMLIKFLSLLALGFVILYLHSKKVTDIIKILNKDFWPSLGWGALALFVSPIVIVLLLFTVVGWAIALLMAGLLLVGMLYGMIVSLTAIGEWILKKVTKRHWRSVSQNWSLVLGVFLFSLIVFIPILGGLIKLLIISTGLGATILFCHKSK